MPQDLFLYSFIPNPWGQSRALAKVYADRGSYHVQSWQYMYKAGEDPVPLTIAEAIIDLDNRISSNYETSKLIVDISETGMAIVNHIRRYKDIAPKLVTLNEKLTTEELAAEAIAIPKFELAPTILMLTQRGKLDTMNDQAWGDEFRQERESFSEIDSQCVNGLSRPRMRAVAIACWYGERLDRREILSSKVQSS